MGLELGSAKQGQTSPNSHALVGIKGQTQEVQTLSHMTHAPVSFPSKAALSNSYYYTGMMGLNRARQVEVVPEASLQRRPSTTAQTSIAWRETQHPMFQKLRHLSVEETCPR